MRDWSSFYIFPCVSHYECVCVWGGGGGGGEGVKVVERTCYSVDTGRLISFASKVVSSALACASDVCTSVRSFCIAGKQGVTSTCFFLHFDFFFYQHCLDQLEVVLQFHGEPFSAFVGFQPGTCGSSASACLRAAAVKTCGEAVATIQKVSISKCN